jgi:lipopolysaccharide transport system ATP-binding protein
MSDCAIRAEGLGKYFRFNRRHRARSLHETVERLAHTPLGPFRPAATSDDGGFWALRNVSFEVKHGEVVGVLGANGAGKSVLLKILSRVTAPSEGRAELSGHVGALLEVGAGFHPELSGRDNVYFNGAILGMPRAQIRQKFDEIVAFSEIESFIDMPVKLYSSGMRMRLAFSVAVHVEPDILLIDEALAVGDASFRAKCRRTISKLVEHDRTLLVVSHDASVVGELCTRAILIEEGRMVADGTTADVLDRHGGAPRN